MIEEKEIVRTVDISGTGRDGFRGGGGDDGGGFENYQALPISVPKFGLWLFLGSVIMLFAAFTGAYIVRSAGSDWMNFKFPDIFWFNTGVLILSSIFIQLSYLNLKRNSLTKFKVLFGISTLLGVLFLTGQYIGWRELSDMGIYLRTNPSSSFFYLLTGAHAVHLLGGIFVLLYVFIRALRNVYNAERKTGVELSVIYWHFLDVLWLYLFIFLNVMSS